MSLENQSKGADRYNTSSKGDILSRALEKVLSEKAKSKRSSSNNF